MTEFTVEDAARGERSVEERMTEKRERMSRSPNNTLESLGLDAELLARRAIAPACPAERVHPDVEAVVSDLVSEAGLHGHSLGAWDEARECLEHAMELAQVMCMACSNVHPMHVCTRASS